MEEWQVVASGDSNSVPDVQLESGVSYLLKITLPFALPIDVAGLVQGALQALGLNVQSVAFNDTVVTVVFYG